MSLILLLVDSKTPHAKSLAAIILARAKSLTDGDGDPIEADDEAIRQVVLLAEMFGDPEPVH